MPSVFSTLNRSSLFFKAMLMLVIVVSVVAGAISYLHHGNMMVLINRMVLERELAAAELISENLFGATRFDDAKKATEHLELFMGESNDQIRAAAVFKADGSVMTSKTAATGDLDGLISNGRKNFETALAQPVVDDQYFFVPIEATSGSAVDGSERQPAIGILAVQWSSEQRVVAARSELRNAVLIASLIAIAVVAAALWWNFKSFVRPINELRGAINDISHGKLDVVVPQTGRKDELGSISCAVEDLRSKLKTSEGVRIDAAYKSAAFTAASACLMLVDSNYIIRYINPAMGAFLEMHRENIPQLTNMITSTDAIGMSLDSFHANGSQIRTRLSHLRDETFETVVTFGEARVALSISAVTDDAGARVGMILEWNDVTRDWLNKAILDAIDSNQMRADFGINGQLLWANAPLCEAMGQPLESLKGKKLRDILEPAAQGEPGAEDIMRTALDQPVYAEIGIKTQSGAAIVVEGGFSCVRDTKDVPIRFMLLGRDVTRQVNDMRDARAARKVLERDQNDVVEALRLGLRRLNDGDLTASITVPFAGSYEDLRVDYNQTVETLASAMREIAQTAESIKNECGDISSTADGLSRRTENTAATLEQTAAALDELTASVKITAQGAADSDKAVRDAKLNAEQSGEVVLETVSAMDLISESSEKITSIIKVIDDIAFQTNLLALNAGVEAARAGEAGRGFAVVASEVRALAQRSSDAAREINELIAKSGGQVKRGVELVGRTGDALQSIVGAVSKISELVSGIAESSQQQSLNLAEINQSVNQLDQSTQQNAARLEETTAASESLRKEAVGLVQTVSHFNFGLVQQTDEAVVDFRPAARAAATPRVPANAARVASSASSAAAAGWEDF